MCPVIQAMTFADRLSGTPVMLEVVPPHRRSKEALFEKFVGRVRDAVAEIPHLDAVNLPEVIDENHLGRPFYRNLDPRRCVQLLDLGPRVAVIVNKVVVHLEGEAGVESWVKESLDAHGLRNFVLVGGVSRHNVYPGPSVAEANGVLRRLAAGRKDVTCGNITIPERPGEPQRMLEKTRAGCDFFTTQVLFEPEPLVTVLREYGQACAGEGLRAATVLLSFAPVADYEDVEFLAWLGATVTPETEDALLANGDAGAASLEVARSIWGRVRDAVAASRHPVRLGVNVEEISPRNFDLAVAMAKEFPSWKATKA